MQLARALLVHLGRLDLSYESGQRVGVNAYGTPSEADGLERRCAASAKWIKDNLSAAAEQ
jgi:hypothetical protein